MDDLKTPATLRPASVFTASAYCIACGRLFGGGEERCLADDLLLVQIDSNLFADSDLCRQYEIQELLGIGGWGLVFKAKQLSLERFVAIKLLHRHMVSDPVAVDRFKREAMLVSKLTHTNITTIFDYGQLPSGQFYFIMEYVDGKNLDDMLNQSGRLSFDQCRPLFLQLCDGLQAAHSKNIIHRDLKPSNIRITDEENGLHVRLIDFGLGRLISTGEVGQLTRTGNTVGSPHYMSPEQCMGQSVDQRSDIYSLGCIMYEMLTGKRVVSGGTYYECMHAHINGTPPDLASSGVRVPAAVQRILDRCLAKDPEHRYQNIGELRDDLQNCPSAPNTVSVVKGGRRNLPRALTLTCATAATIACIIAAVFLVSTNFKKQPQTPAVSSIKTAAPAPAAARPSASHARDGWLQFMMQGKTDNLELHLSGQGITDADLPYIVEHSRARYFGLGQNQLTDAGIGIIATSPTVENLNLDGNAITDAGISNLAGMKNLRTLTLCNTKIDGSCFAQGFANLQVLKILDSPLAPSSLKYIASLPRLEVLTLARHLVNDQSLVELAKSKSIDELYLAGNDISDEGLKALSKMPLTTLYLQDCKIKGPGLVYLKDMRGLNLSIGPASDEYFQSLKQITGLRTLDLTPDPSLSPQAFLQLRSLPLLTELEINSNSQDDSTINDDVLANIARLKQLKRLSIGSNTITEEGLMKLKDLKLSQLTLTTDNVRSLDRLRKKMPYCLIRLEH